MTPEVFEMTMTLRGGYGLPPDDITRVLVDGAVWRRFDDQKWGQVYEWGRDTHQFAPDTQWVEAPNVALPPPSHAWHDIDGRKWAYARGLFTTPDAPPVHTIASLWVALDERNIALARDLITRAPGADYPQEPRFGHRMIPVLRAGDRWTSLDAFGPPCAVWRDGLLIAIVMPLDRELSTDDGQTLAEIVQERLRAAVEVNHG